MLARTARWVREQFAFLVVLVALLSSVAYLLVEPGRWGRSSGGVAVSVLLAGLIRATVPTRLVGMLKIRGRTVDSITFLLLGGLILAVDIRLHG